jgi:transcriptional regulator with XRE-family HTH domain
MKIRERLLEFKVKLGIKSDYKLAEALGCSRQRISELMSGKVKPDAYFAIRIGEVLGIHPLILLAEFEAESAKTTERKAFWENFAQRIKTGAVAMLVLISTAFWCQDSEAAGLILDTHNA